MRNMGDREACRYCDQDIEWHGRKFGWLDRGGNRDCVPTIRQGEVLHPKTKHQPPQLTATTRTGQDKRARRRSAMLARLAK